MCQYTMWISCRYKCNPEQTWVSASKSRRPICKLFGEMPREARGIRSRMQKPLWKINVRHHSEWRDILNHYGTWFLDTRQPFETWVVRDTVLMLPKYEDCGYLILCGKYIRTIFLVKNVILCKFCDFANK